MCRKNRVEIVEAKENIPTLSENNVSGEIKVPKNGTIAKIKKMRRI